MKTSKKNPQAKQVEKPVKNLRQIRKIPEELMAIKFDDGSAWLIAHEKHDLDLIHRAVVMAFRRRYMLSQADCAKQLGVSAGSVCKWESGESNLRWKTKREMVESGWFKPFHFGLDSVESVSA